MAQTQQTEDAEVVAGLVESARRGDQAAFRSLYDLHVRAAFGVAVGILGRGDDAEDVVQESFVKLFGRLGDLDEPRAFGAWLLRTVRNRAIDVARSSKVSSLDPWDLPEDAEPVAAEPDHGVDMTAGLALAEAREVVDAAFGALGERDATALRLSALSDVDGESLATALAVDSRQHAYTILNRARSRFRVAAGAFLLTRHGRSCDRLRQLLAGGDEGFSASLVRTVHGHVRECETCERRRSLLLEHPEMAHAMEPPAVGPAAADRMWDGIAEELPPSPGSSIRRGRRLSAVGAVGAIVLVLSLVFAAKVGEDAEPPGASRALAGASDVSDLADDGEPGDDVPAETLPGPFDPAAAEPEGEEVPPSVDDATDPPTGDPAPRPPGPEPETPGVDGRGAPADPPPGDTEPPKIGRVAVSPARVLERGCRGAAPATVTVSASDPSGLASASASAAGVSGRLSVSGTTASGTIGPFANGTAPPGGTAPVAVTVTVTDTAGNSATTTSKITVVSCQSVPTVGVPDLRAPTDLQAPIGNPPVIG